MNIDEFKTNTKKLNRETNYPNQRKRRN